MHLIMEVFLLYVSCLLTASTFDLSSGEVKVMQQVETLQRSPGEGEGNQAEDGKLVEEMQQPYGKKHFKIVIPCKGTLGSCGPGVEWGKRCDDKGACGPLKKALCYIKCNYTQIFHPTKKDVGFYLYTSTEKGVLYRVDTADRVPASALKGYVRFVVHGWHGNYKMSSLQQLGSLLLQTGTKYKVTTAVFAVDWRRLADSLIFFPSCAASEYVGQLLAQFIQQLEKRGLPRRSVHLVGFSLGGKVVSAAGKHFKSPKLGRISGIDSPTGCLILSCGPNLEANDAKFVDSLHNTIYSGHKQQGHTDFYPNGPHSCTKDLMEHPIKTLLSLNKDHQMALLFYIASINQCKYRAKACKRWSDYPAHCEKGTNFMGFHAQKPPGKRRKRYYLAVKKQAPYC